MPLRDPFYCLQAVMDLLHPRTPLIQVNAQSSNYYQSIWQSAITWYKIMVQAQPGKATRLFRFVGFSLCSFDQDHSLCPLQYYVFICDPSPFPCSLCRYSQGLLRAHSRQSNVLFWSVWLLCSILLAWTQSPNRCLADVCGALHCDYLASQIKISKKRPCNRAAVDRNKHLCEVFVVLAYLLVRTLPFVLPNSWAGRPSV